MAARIPRIPLNLLRVLLIRLLVRSGSSSCSSTSAVYFCFSIIWLSHSLLRSIWPDFLDPGTWRLPFFRWRFSSNFCPIMVKGMLNCWDSVRWRSSSDWNVYSRLLLEQSELTLVGIAGHPIIGKSRVNICDNIIAWLKVGKENAEVFTSGGTQKNFGLN